MSATRKSRPPDAANAQPENRPESVPENVDEGVPLESAFAEPARVKLLVASIMQPLAEYVRGAKPLRRPSHVPG